VNARLGDALKVELWAADHAALSAAKLHP